MFSPIGPSGLSEHPDIAPGDVLRSEYGRTVRTVVAVEDDDVIVRSPTGSVDTIPLSSLCQHWRKIGERA